MEKKILKLEEECNTYKAINLKLQEQMLLKETTARKQLFAKQELDNIDYEPTDPIAVDNGKSGDTSAVKDKNANCTDEAIDNAPTEMFSVNVKTELHDDDNVRALPRYTTFKIKRDGVQIERIHLGDGIVIDEDVWDMIKNKDDSKFVKDLAVAIWGRTVLMNRSLGKKAAPRLPNQGARKLLTPSKRNVLRKCFEERLRKRGMKGELNKALKREGPYLTELINDIIKREIKELEKGANKLE